METQKYCVKWKNRFEHFQTIFADFLAHQVLCDVTLVSEGETFKAHQFVLSGCSSYFRKVFEEVPAAQHPIIFLRDVTSQEVRCLLEYLYKGETVVAKHLMPNFLKTCESLYIQGLYENQTTDKQRVPLKERDQNRNGDLIQSKQSSTNDEWFHEYSQDKPESPDLTQIDFPNIDMCVTNNTIQSNIMDSPPHSPQSIVFSPGDSEGMRNLEKTVNDTMESVIMLPERNSEVLEVSDNDSGMNLCCENVHKTKEDAKRKYFLESLHLRANSCHSDDSLDEFRLVLSPDIPLEQSDDETDESELIFQKRNVNRSGCIENPANVRLTMTVSGQTNAKQIDEGVVQPLDDKIRAIQQAQRMRVVLSKFPLHPHVYNTRHSTRTPYAVENVAVSNDESVIDGLGESETSVSENVELNNRSYFCSGVYKSIDCVPDKLKHLYCVQCCRCVKSLLWKKHLRIHSLKMRRCLKKKKRI